ncbi:hypothetical protein SAST44_02425 [Staphylococcus aureus]|nr:hypothetical protein SAST44_02425 [Staphylococcus aureus]QGQ78909.1 hypothetical protein SAST45_02402 [Staphylococcus aureus]
MLSNKRIEKRSDLQTRMFFKKVIDFKL